MFWLELTEFIEQSGEKWQYNVSYKFFIDAFYQVEDISF